MTEPYIGEIRMAGFNYAPRGWALCNGQLLAISQNEALFALLGTQFGGDGITTFALPNMQGRTPMHQGTGAGLSPRSMGEQAGAQTVTLLSNQMPVHNHPVFAYGEDASLKTPGGNYLGSTAASAYAPTADTTMNGQMTATAGGSLPHENMPPFLVVNFIIALVGIFPSRN